MKSCFCNRLYRMSIPSAVTEYAFSGSLCRIHAFETKDETRFCLSMFNLSDYKHLHFPHDEYKCLIGKLYALLCTRTTIATAFPANPFMQKLIDNALSVKQIPFDGDYKIKFGDRSLTIGPVTAFGLVKTAPFTDVDVFSIISTSKEYITCDPKWDICICGKCSVFKRLIDFESATAIRFSLHKPENVILFEHCSLENMEKSSEKS